MIHPSRQAYVEAETEAEGIELGSIPLDRDYELPSTAAGIPAARASAIMSQFERKRRMAALVVPTDDQRVRTRLRELGQPITLFGEGPAERRDRLRECLTDVEEAATAATAAAAAAAAEDGQEEEAGDKGDADVEMADGHEEDAAAEEFYTEGSQQLLDARRDMARFSLPRARARLARLRDESTIPLRTHIKHRKTVKERLQRIDLYGSQIAGERPVSIVRFSADGQTLAAGNWAGGIKLFSVPDLEETASFRAHSDRVGGLAWFPSEPASAAGAAAARGQGTVSLASGGGDGTVALWSAGQQQPLAVLDGHSARVCRVEFHPSGRYLASASYDTTWRLWDVQQTSELLLQEGHAREVYAVAFNSDGSLLASGGLDSIGRIWDLRTGRTVMILEGHVREIYGLDWGADGFRLLSGSADGWVKCWDLRAVRNIGGIGAHQGVVSDLRWYKASSPPPPPPPDAAATPSTDGTFFVSGGFDKSVNVFSADDWSLAKSLSGHAGNVLSVDVSSDAQWIASCGHDRTVKLWT